MATITVGPLGRTIEAAPGTLLRDALQEAGILLDSPCGGKGTCRQCRVIVDPAPADGTNGLKPEEAAAGVRLACQCRLTGDCTVTIPSERMSRAAWTQGIRDDDIQTAVEKRSLRRVRLALPQPSLEDQRADWERLEGACTAQGIRAGHPDLSSLEHLSAILRASGWSPDALCDEEDLLWLSAGGKGPACGFAVDLGTTTVDIALVNLESGERLARRAFLNGQVAFGADVVSRAQSFHADREPVRTAALRTILEGAHELLSATGVSPAHVVKTVVVGNPIMIHILNGIDPYQLTHVPYVPVTAGALVRSPRDFGWTFQEAGSVESLPLVSAYVGADTIGMIVSLDLEAEHKTTLSIDIGTNGEMVLARQGALVTTSTAAGPAFEGAEIACGMRALPGAVYGVGIGEDGTLALRVVGDRAASPGGAPKGICGTGLIAGIAQMLERGLVDATGRIVDPEEVSLPTLRARLFVQDGEPCFALSNDRRVYISQSDIRKLQLAKGAVRTGVETLLESQGVTKEDLDALRLAGNFGAGLDPRAAMRIGLIPEMDISRVEVVGNAALRGAVMVLLSRDWWRKAQSAARNARFIELGGKPEFQNRFMESMLF
jgi:uncharacterized 2Fe-2S/4Fe-4S cluster protein (DUF4445 family)